MNEPGSVTSEASPRLIAHWWTGSYGSNSRRDVWVEGLVDGRLQVRWRGGDRRDRDGRHVTQSKRVAWDAVKALIRDEPERWRRIV